MYGLIPAYNSIYVISFKDIMIIFNMCIWYVIPLGLGLISSLLLLPTAMMLVIFMTTGSLWCQKMGSLC